MSEAHYEQLGLAFIGRPLQPVGAANERFVLILGWLDGQFRYVEKYAQWYRTNGYTAIIMLSKSSDHSPFDIPKTGSDLDPDSLKPLFDYLAEKGLITNQNSSSVGAVPSKHFVVHVFSNGGCFLLRRLILCLGGADKCFTPATGVLLDSCPSKLSAAGGAGFISASIAKHWLAKAVLWHVAYAYFVVVLYFLDQEKTPIEVSAKYAISQKNVEGNLIGPRLFLYSDTDELVICKEVQSRIEEAKQEGGFVVKEKKFVGSEHVKHAVMHKEEYWGTVQDFLNSELF
ncbi:hypothetical protein HDU84_005524 [Entophlyctis sp. JEL0112]|nr:hypothetical protein HDU84_005524 [Entophlyctis sp. JEL0112]